MSRPKIKISAQPQQYDALRTLATAVILSMTNHAGFPAPSPSLAALQTATDELNAAITAYGTPGHRGSRIDLVNLRAAAVNVHNMLKLEASYVVNCMDPNANDLEQKAFLLSSGFEVKKERVPQGVLQAPVNLHQTLHPRYSLFTPRLKWSKSQGLTCRWNVKLYVVFRSSTYDFSSAVIIGTTTKTNFVDVTAPQGASCYYFVAGMNYAGTGVACDGVKVVVPAK